MAGIDAARGEVLDGGRPEQVVAHPRHHRHPRAAQPRGHGLVGAFPSEAEMEFAPENGLAGTRKVVGKRGQVDVRAPNHDDVGLPVHSSIIVTASRYSWFATVTSCILALIPCAESVGDHYIPKDV